MINEVAVFEWLNKEVTARGLKSISMTVGGICGDYVAVFNEESDCKIAQTIAEAASLFPGPQQQACEMYAKADKLKSESAQLRDRAVKLFPQEPKSFGPDD